MALAIYLIAAFLLSFALVGIAGAPLDQSIVNALIVWLPPSILAFAMRNKATAIARYFASSLALVLMLAIMLKGMTA